MLSARGRQEHGTHCNLQTCTPHDTPVLYSPTRREVRSGQRLSMSGRQLSLYKCLYIKKFPQPGPYLGSYCTNAHSQRDPNHLGGPRSSHDPLSGHTPDLISPQHTGVLTQYSHDRIQVACITGACRHRPRSPSDHRDRHP